MSRCPTCGQPVRDRLPDRTVEGLRDLEDQHPGFRFDTMRDLEGYIVSSYKGKSMICNRTFKQVKDMLTAMSGGTP